MATDLAKNFIAGGVGGVCTVVIGHPFDTIKVRLQTMPASQPGTQALYNGALDCLKKTIAKDGFSALYRGMAAPLVGVSPLFATFFGGCELGRYIQKKTPDQTKFTFFENFNSGALAGILTTSVMAPGERIKCILQVQAQSGDASGIKYKGPADVIKKLYKEGGIRSIYRGTAATLLRDVPASGTYLAVYQYLKEKLAGGSNAQLSPTATLLAGGIAGMANWAVCIPADVLKSRLQTAPEGKYPDGIRGVLREVLRTEGPKALFRGFVPIMLRAFPANAACFMGVEVTLHFLR